MDILEKIIKHKRKEVEILKKQLTSRDLEQSLYFDRETVSLKENVLSKKGGIIAEFKRKSPSKGVINGVAKPEEVVPLYEKAGVAGTSILTDEEFFGGTVNDIIKVRPEVQIPILRKEFIIDEFQILQAKSIGADAILLIAECLTPAEVKQYAQFAKRLNLEVLLEIHSAEMLDHICPELSLVGVNNRNLKNFEVSIQSSIDLYDQIPSEFAKISESGVSNIKEIHTLQQIGFDGFLIGENFMKTENPGQACIDFIKEI